MSNPKVSVIVPVYNIEYYLEESLNCLVNQTIFDEIEVFMIDDGSTDNSRYIIDKFDFKYENFHAIHKINEGPAVARNFGLDRVNGDYIHFMDSDDFLLFDAYEKLYNFAIEHNYEIVIGDFLRFNDDKTWSVRMRNENFENLNENLLNTNIFDNPHLGWDMGLWNKLYSRKFLSDNNIRFFHTDLLFEDNLFSNEVHLKANKVGILNDFVYCWRYREIGDSLTQSFYLNRGKDLYEMVVQVNNLLNNTTQDKKVLSEKYKKLLEYDLPIYIEGIKNYSDDDFYYCIESAYDIINIVPNEFFSNLNSYFKMYYEIILNKDWVNLRELLSLDLRNDPHIPINIDKKYTKNLNFLEDSKKEVFDPYVFNVGIDENNIKFKFSYKIPYYKNNKNDKIYLVIKNPNYDDVLIESGCFKNNSLYVPIDLINYGENIIIVKYKTNNFEKEHFLKTNIRKTFSFEGFDIDIARGKTTSLRLIKRKKEDFDCIIDDIEFTGDKFILHGYSNNKIDCLVLNDYLDFYKFYYPVNLVNGDSRFCIEINYNDFLKFPIKKWELKLNDNFNKINLTDSFRFFNNIYIISFKNYGNKVICEFSKYDSVSKIKEYDDKINVLSKEVKVLDKKNKNLKKIIDEYKSRKDVKIVNKLKKLIKR